MYHKLRFHVDYNADLYMKGKSRLEQVIFRAGEIVEAQVRPFIIETDEGPVETADLFLAGDGTLLEVRMEYFSFE